MASTIDRRRFLQVSAVGGGSLLVGFSLFGCQDKQKPADTTAPVTPAMPPATEPVTFNGWVRIDPDDTVTFSIDKAEMGQGVLTSLAMILAEELDVDWSKVRSQHSPQDFKLYGLQLTGGSQSVRTSYDKLRQAGAAARAMLVQTAAKQWNVQDTSCRTENSRVIHPDGKTSLRYGELLAGAAAMTPPETPALKDPKSFRIIGKPVPRLDTPSKINGTAEFGLDVKRPGMLIAQVAHSPTFGGKVKSVDASAAKQVPGVHDVVEIPSGVAVVADNFWTAKKGRDALKIEWDAGPNAKLSTASIDDALRAAVGKGKAVRQEGDAASVLGASKKKIEAVYEVPFLAHAAMEPLNCTVEIGEGGCDVWTGTQLPTQVHQLAGEITGVAPDKIRVHTTMLGGGFGRRAKHDFVEEALHVAKATGKPVKLVWTREDDMRAGYYRPVSYNAFSGSVDEQGWPNAWVHRISSPPLTQQFIPLQDGVDSTTIEGASNLPYGIANLTVTCAHPEVPVPTWFWRSVGSSMNGYVTECFLDELAALGGKDPLEVRLRLLEKHPRHKRVLERAAEAAGWGKPVGEGRALGLAVHESFGTIVAEVAEVSIDAAAKNAVRVHKVVCAVDCGVAVNPNTIEAQMESAIVYGLSAALWGKIDIEKGGAKQGNFSDYRVLRMHEMPEVQTILVAEGDPMGGIGEPGTPPIAPAVCNALRVLTGKPVRKLPIAIPA
jgi:isoquinoline 1-oxidoreductase beta subunit